jgi:hypothetical protein
MSLTPEQRHSRRNPCQVCGGHASLPAGKGERCAGFLSADGEWEHCQREEYASGLALNEHTTPPTYAHKLHGDCLCGTSHGPAVRPTTSRQLPPRITRYELLLPGGTLAGIHVRKDYLDAEGRPYRDKELRWEQHNGRGAKEMPLYGLLADREAPTDALRIICEGEKATDALNAALKQAGRADVIAVGTVTGAPAFPCDASLTRYLGYPVALWPDNDDVGRKQMTSIAARLVALGAMPPDWVDWPDAPPAGDAFDYFAAGGTVEGMLQLVADHAPSHSSEDANCENREVNGVSGLSSHNSQFASSPRQPPAGMKDAAYYGLAGDIVRAIEPHTEADPRGVLVQLLTIFGAIAGRRTCFKVSADRHYPNLYVEAVPKD